MLCSSIELALVHAGRENMDFCDALRVFMGVGAFIFPCLGDRIYGCGSLIVAG